MQHKTVPSVSDKMLMFKIQPPGVQFDEGYLAINVPAYTKIFALLYYIYFFHNKIWIVLKKDMGFIGQIFLKAGRKMDTVLFSYIFCSILSCITPMLDLVF